MNKSYSHDSFLYGVVYYPEQWPEASWERDLADIAESGMNVVRMGEGAWSIWEPEEERIEGDHGDANVYATSLAY